MDESLMELLAQMAKDFEKIEKAAKQVISDRISSPVGAYDIQTGPHPFGPTAGQWVTVMAVTTKDGKHYGPVGVEIFDDEESAMKGHDSWRRIVMDSPPLVLKDAITEKVTVIGF